MKIPVIKEEVIKNMEWTIRPASKIQGTIEIPADKSITHRAIMFSAIAEGDSRIENYLPADDCMQTLKAFQNLGVKIEKDEKTLLIHGAGLKGLKPFQGIIDAGNSGTTARLLTGILSGQDFISRISGDESLSRRPMKRIIEPLSMMGIKIKARENNFLPIEIEGSSKLRKIDYKSPAASAQVKSCIILAALQSFGTSSIEEPANSRNHTEIMLKARGVAIEIQGKKVSVKGPAKIKAMDMVVPADISSAAFFMIAAAIMPGSSLEMTNVGVNPTRDGILEVLKSMGASIEVRNQRKVSGEAVGDISIKGSTLRSSCVISGSLIPRLIDEIPILALAATQAEGITQISDAGELRVKESDRLKTIASELNKMGANIEEKKDGLIINGKTKLRGAEVESFGDHRIAMMLAIAGLVAEGETLIKNVECVDTSFPGFFELLQSLVNPVRNSKTIR